MPGNLKANLARGDMTTTQAKLLDLILEQGGIGIIVCDAQGTMRGFNREAERQHGVGFASLGADEWIDRYNLKQLDGQKVRLEDLALYRAMQGEQNARFTYRVRAPRGEERVIDGHANPLRHADGTLAGAVVISRDHTERFYAERRTERALEELSRSEQLIRSILENSHDVLMMLDEGGTILWSNPRAHQALGRASAQALIGRRFVELWPGAMAGQVAEQLASAAVGRQASFIGTMGGPSGPASWWSVSITSQGSDGSGPRMFASLHDISPVKRAEAEIQAQAHFAEQLVGIVSHDLRNPISAILLSVTQLGRHDRLEPRQRRAVERMGWAAERANRLIYDLLDFTQSRLGGGLKVRRSSCDIGELVRRAVEEVRVAHPDRDIQLAVAGDARAEVDGDRVAQVMINLVGNALQHGPPEGTIQVRVDSSAEQVALSVHNGGPAIPSSLLGQLFEPMRSGEHGGSRQRSIGLGLYIVKSIVEAHGGQVEVRSQAPAGTTFCAAIPRGPTTEDAG